MEIDSFQLLEEKKNPVAGSEPSLINGSQLLVTVQSQGIYLYDIHDQKCTKSWLLSPGTRFSSHTKSIGGHFYAIQENKYLCAWTMQDSKIEDLPRKNVGRLGDVFDLYLCLGSDTVVLLFENGKICVYNLDLEILHAYDQDDMDGKEILWAEVHRLSDNSILVVEVTKYGDYMHLEFLSIEENMGEYTSTFLSKHLISNISKDIVSCSFNFERQTFSVFWSDLILESFICRSADELLHSNDSIKTVNTRKLNLFVSDSSNVESVFLSTGQLVLVGRVGNNIVLTVWDTEHGILQGSHEMPYKNKKRNKKRSKKIISVTPNCERNLVIITLDTGIICCPIFCPIPTLASAIGKFSDTKQVLSNDTDTNPLLSKTNLDLKELLLSDGNSDTISDQNWEKMLNENDAEKNIIEKLTNRDVTPDLDQFMLIFNEYIDIMINEDKKKTSNTVNTKTTRWKNIADLVEKQRIISRKKWASKQHSERTSTFSHHFGSAIGNRCLEDMFWEPLRYLIRCKAISYQGLPTIIQKLIEHNNIELLIHALLNMTDIPENEIVSLISYFIQMDRNVVANVLFESYFDGTLTKRLSPEEAIDQVLSIIITAPNNQILMQRCLRSLSLKEVLVTITFLSNWLDNYSLTISKISQKNRLRIPSLIQVIEWCTYLIDSHLSQLILVDECHETIEKIQKSVNAHAEICEVLGGLVGCLGHYFQSETPRAEISEYQIEVYRI
eukprot:TRINITY_DN11524_c0_g1_i1.p1 TRINITY_DN11524_c0_g1~~TRINITY_DN11524_c0_g1_i1.p1  ORF type:complete len:744 (-),score=127.17 TRINITY_DN11524_c0_g1_i1:94-2268(-)